LWFVCRFSTSSKGQEDFRNNGGGQEFVDGDHNEGIEEEKISLRKQCHLFYYYGFVKIYFRTQDIVSVEAVETLLSGSNLGKITLKHGRPGEENWR